MSSGIPLWLTEKLKSYKTYNINDLQFHSALRVNTSHNRQNVLGQSGGGLFIHPKNTREFRNIIKKTLLKDFESDNTSDYFH